MRLHTFFLQFYNKEKWVYYEIIPFKCFVEIAKKLLPKRLFTLRDLMQNFQKFRILIFNKNFFKKMYLKIIKI